MHIDMFQEVNKFLRTLQTDMAVSGDAILKDTTFGYSGSAYEGTAVSKLTDYDILLQLPQPYIGDNFKVRLSRYHSKRKIDIVSFLFKLISL